MTIRKRLLLLVAGLTLMAMVGPAVVMFASMRQSAEQQRITADSLLAIHEAMLLESEVESVRDLVAGTVAMTSLPDLARIKADFTAGTGELTRLVGALGRLALTPQMTEAVVVLDRVQQAWTADAARILGLTPSPEIPTTELLARQVTEMMGILAEVQRIAGADAQTLTARSETEFEQMLLAVLAAWAVILLVVATVALRVARQISASLGGLGRVMQALASGDTSRPVEGVERRDELGDMARTVTVFRTALIERSSLEEQRDLAAEAARAAARREEMIRRIEAAVEAGQRGDFAGRIATDGLDGSEVKVIAGVNDLLAVVQHGVGAVLEMLTALADADLTRRMQGSFAGDFARLSGAADETVARLTELIGGIRTAADSAQVAAQQITATAGDLSARVDSQASTLEETTATMESLAGTVRSNAEALAAADRLAGELAGLTRAGTQTVEQSMHAVGRIETSSGRISEIITVIQAIAFQTNLLALNAAVEAARAGDAGKGFAVVASEVRTLAQRSAQAAADITVLIRESATTVEEGVGLVRETGASLARIEEATARLAGMISTVSEAGTLQAASIREVTTGIGHIGSMTDANAGVVGSSVAVADTLSAALAQLEAMVATFRVQNRAGGSSTRPQRRAA